MRVISDTEIDFILDDIAQKGIVTEDVRYNLLDHVCCIIENEMSEGENFFKFYENTIARFYKNELSEIEDETRDLLTFKYYYAMKRTLKLTGLLSATLILIGAFFKFQHWPGAGLTLFAGLIIFSLVFVPLNIVLKYQDDKEKKNRLIMILGFAATMIGTIGVLFKVMHWPWANYLFYGSFIFFLLLFIPIYFFTKYKDPDSKFNAIIHTTFMIAGCGMLLMLFNVSAAQDIRSSVASMDAFQSQNVVHLEGKNQQLFLELDGNQNADIRKLHEVTRKFSETIDAIKVNLIAHSNEVSKEVAATLTIANLNNTNDVAVIQKHFDQATGDLSYTGFKEAVNDYNENLSTIIGGTGLIPLDISDLQMTKTVITVVLHELVDIQVHILSNENSYLNLKKGLLVRND